MDWALKIEGAIKNIAKSIVCQEINKLRVELENNSLADKIVTDMKNAGAIWSDREDEALEAEVRQFLEIAARSHGRSATAISCRVRDKELLF